MNRDKLIEWILAEITSLEQVEELHNRMVEHYLGNIKKLALLLKDA